MIPVSAYHHPLGGWQVASELELRTAVDDLLRRGEACKLQIGAGSNSLSGWINTDVKPGKEYVYCLDARRTFPMGDGSVNYIFCEHMIEHISLRDGRGMLHECNRVLANGGKIRLATPDLRKIIAIYSSCDREVLEYKSWAQRYNHCDNDRTLECVLVNNFMHAWGHQFIYDEATLCSLLEGAGFSGIMRCPVGRSDDPTFCGVERHGADIGAGPNEFETMVLEAFKGS